MTDHHPAADAPDEFAYSFGTPPLVISRRDRVVTAGSCFARHIGPRLRMNGFTYLVTEQTHPWFSGKEADGYNYGVYSARYGDIYTSRQLLQLIQRAYLIFQPDEDMWNNSEGLFVDPFRPRINPTAFSTKEEYLADRMHHFRCVREALETLNYLVFTIAHTGAWTSRRDGAVYPVIPGAAGGRLDPELHEFVDFGIAEIVEDLTACIDTIRSVNAKARIIFTVSPVSQTELETGQHARASPAHSRSVLRAACHEVCHRTSGTAYFPSCEIIMEHPVEGMYFDAKLMSLTEQAANHAAQLFLKQFGAATATASPTQSGASITDGNAQMDDIRKAVRELCDEVMSDSEKVRLVIWDMDETFWNGTITEGGHEYIRAHHDIVIKLAQRGIISTICSKNDLEPVKEILEREGLWSYFVFPSINWEPKGPRIAALIETFRLRPQTVMFLDDNPMNLNEAVHFAPGLQIAEPSIIRGILDNPLFAGKDDLELSRLRQYKLLEKRHADEQVAVATGGGNHEFLRASNIRVVIEFDIRKYIDRAVELVNRTNQLNFTKRRLPEEPEVARAELLGLIEQFDMQAGLVRVLDNYGDYGFVGFYVIRTRDGRSDLVHYCFSCRTLGMGIETAVYRRIGRPWLPMVGEVLSDPREDALPADWITFTTGVGTEADTQKAPKFGDVVMRGGCDFASVAHYFIVSAASVASEGPIARNGVPIRRDHSIFLTQALDGIPPETMAEFAKLGYAPEDFETRIFDRNLENPIICLSFWTDSEIGVYRHKELGLRIPFVAPYHFPIKPASNVFDLPADVEAEGFGPDHWIFRAIEHLREYYEYEGTIGEATFKRALARILGALPPTATVFVLGANEKWFNHGNYLVYDHPHHTALNQWMREVVGHFPNVMILPIRHFIYAEAEAQSVNHFERMVYFRIYQEISRVVASLSPARRLGSLSTEATEQKRGVFSPSALELTAP